MDSHSNPEECDCAPSEREKKLIERERRLVLPEISRRRALGFGALGGLLLAGGATTFAVAPAFAESYPSWEDVEAAKASEAAKAAEVTKIEGLINTLTAEVAAAQAEAQRTSDEFYEAQQAFFDAAKRADDLQAQADEQAALALESAQKAGRIAAQLYRDGGDDTALELFFSGSAATADDLLARLGTMDKLLERNQTVYAEAVTARDTAQSLSDQAEAARAERDRLQQEAEAKMVAAQEAAVAAQTALDNQNAHLDDLEAQLAALKDDTAATVAGYEAGVEARRKAAEAAAAAAAAAAAKAAEEAANNGGGVVSSSGWCRPSGGWRSAGYGPRTVICSGGYCTNPFHYGVDLASGWRTPIYAAQTGQVTYAGWNGSYGNYIRIDHGGGIGTGYAHIDNGALYVGYGSWVGAGQVIAGVGTTGASTGYHLHFEVYQNGYPINPIDYLAARGVSV
ncbi:hypothetical protein GCM10009808_23820 [Microbacterium sediminicola]|uniref:M23ase beta-sheet core domain-containing protein n=1 Tax=Microbacterium sediminicola TaxID=415210 RepID=A0ABP4UI92_9MICO